MTHYVITRNYYKINFHHDSKYAICYPNGIMFISLKFVSLQGKVIFKFSITKFL